MEIEEFVKDAKIGDVFVLYVSGHSGNPEGEDDPRLTAAVDYEVME
ncbi:hypothetical protein L195_g021626, partial [Trifolium pratense]